jgi:hypothetical protein
MNAIYNVDKWTNIRNHKVPPVITLLEDKLFALLEKDDSPTLSIEETAPVIGMGVPQLRRWVQSGKCPFGMGWEPVRITKTKKENGYSKISKLALWNWMQGGRL